MKHKYVFNIVIYDVLVVLCECENLFKMTLEALEILKNFATKSVMLHISKTRKIAMTYY